MDEHHITLKDYLNREISHLDEKIRLHVISTEDRLERMNELRDMATDMAGRMITRPEHSSLEKRIADVEKTAAKAALVTGAAVSLCISVLAALISHFIK